MQEFQLHTVRRLCAQQAPCEIVLASLHGHADPQSLLCDAVGLPAETIGSFWWHLPGTYRMRLLKRVLSELEGEEANEALLHAYTSRSEDADPGWSRQTFFVSNTLALQLRISSGIGGGMETGGRVWDAAIGLSAYLHFQWKANPTSTADRVVLELGAGPGLPGLLLSLYGAAERVLVTDVVPATLDNLERNIALLPPSAQARVRVGRYDWCDRAAEVPSPVDLILAADCVYEPELAEPLLSTIAAILRRNGPRATALLAAERRGGAWEYFEARMQQRIEQGELACVDLSADVRRALRDPHCPFYCAPATIDRLLLLQLSVPTSSSGLSSPNERKCREPQTPRWRITASVVAGSRGASIQLRVHLRRSDRAI